MAQTTMYAGMTNSPKTSLVDDISANDTTIILADGSVLPDAPNLAVIGETAEAEVIIYSGMSGNRLTGPDFYFHICVCIKKGVTLI